jgi:hypothetical protein
VGGSVLVDAIMQPTVVLEDDLLERREEDPVCGLLPLPSALIVQAHDVGRPLLKHAQFFTQDPAFGNQVGDDVVGRRGERGGQTVNGGLQHGPVRRGGGKWKCKRSLDCSPLRVRVGAQLIVFIGWAERGSNPRPTD